MDIYKLKLTRLQNEIFRLLCIKAGKSLNQREMARMLKVSPTAIAKSLKGLKEEGLIKAEKEKIINLISIELNRDNHRVIGLKRAENLKIVYESGLADYLEEQFAGSTIILFGSYSKGEDTEKSDIDLAVIGRKEKDIDLADYEKMLGRIIRINFYPSLKEIHKNLRSNIIGGITLIGVGEI